MWRWNGGISVIAMVLLVGVATASAAPNVKYFTCSDVANEMHLIHQGITRFAEEATNLTMGKIHFNLVATEPGCSEEELIKQVREGKLDGAVVSVEALATVAPEFRVFTLPYLFPDEEQAYRVLNGPTGSELLRSLKRKGIKGLAFVGMGWRQLVLQENRIQGPADLNGLKIGVVAGPDGELVSILGATPTVLNGAELAGAVDSNELDGLSISLQTLYLGGFQRSGQYVALTRHTFVPVVIIMNPDKYGYLQQSEREGLMRAANRVQEYVREISKLQAEEIKEHLQRDGVQIYEVELNEGEKVDTKLVELAKRLDAKIITNDFNLNKVAQIDGVAVLNINDLANAVKPAVLPDEQMIVKVVKEGKEAGQGIGYLDDGTMVVVDGGKFYMGREIRVIVTSVLQTAAGKMIFAKIDRVISHR